MKKYRVCYAIKRSEYYTIEAVNESDAIDRAFSEGQLDETDGETYDVEDIGVEEVTE
jgi:hypothetical protein